MSIECSFECITQSCNQYNGQSDCNYIYTSYTLREIALCYWDSLYDECISASISLAKRLIPLTQHNVMQIQDMYIT
ncbi:unnamed protein product [Paramecium primaurelia]|uniref:Uncharacterized protein n=1 Tax=Paramecium primaurelia TaxID=5886 RepID=A0A8S1QMX1_PARPR|nr:unnamed protein product [Paramecium primaurelia]